MGIRGWSFGGYLAALAVLRRPDVFHAAVAGAPVTDWPLYDTHYTERYLGHPRHRPGGLRPVLADRRRRPAGAGRCCSSTGWPTTTWSPRTRCGCRSALLAAGRPHSVLPLSGVTHMTPQEVVAENLLLLQVRLPHATRCPPHAGSRPQLPGVAMARRHQHGERGRGDRHRHRQGKLPSRRRRRTP